MINRRVSFVVAIADAIGNASTYITDNTRQLVIF